MRQRTIVDDFLDGLREAFVGFASDFVEERVAPPRAPRQQRPRRAPVKPTKTKATPKTPSATKPEAQGPTLYDDLEVSPRASAETIRAAWLSLSKRYHPDVSKHKGAAERMKQINAAWDIVGDEKKRAAYDREKGIR